MAASSRPELSVPAPDELSRRLLRLASLAQRIRRRVYQRTRTKAEIARRRADLYRKAWEEAVAECGEGSVTVVSGSLLEIRCQGVTLRTRTNLTSLDDSLTVVIAEDKPLAYRLLTEQGLPVPRHQVCAADDLAAAWAFAASLGRPCIVKPARGTSGAIGITTGVDSRWDLALAMAYGGAFDGDLLIEEQVDGGVYRLLYLDGELLDAVVRLPPAVVGDGRSTIAQLVECENQRRMRGGMEASQSLVKIDRELRRTLRGQGMSLSSVPGEGQRVRLKNVVNDNAREENLPATALLCDELVAEGAVAAGAVGARLAGVDVVTPDPSVPLQAAGGVVLEVNTAPGFYYHYMKRGERTPVATLILRRLIEAAT